MMKLMIDLLTDIHDVKYVYTGSTMMMDINVISMDFTISFEQINGDVNIRGVIDGPLTLKAQYDSRTLLNNHPTVQQRINRDLETVSVAINKLL